MKSMYKSFATIIICTGCYFTSLPVFADGWNYGFRLAYFEAAKPGVDDPDNVGVVAGYDWAKDYGLVGIEADISSSFEDGVLAGEAVAVDTAGVYATYKTRGFSGRGLGTYLKLKAGIVYYDLSIGSTSEDEVKASYGLGAGVNMGAVSFEIDFSSLENSEMVNFSVLF